MFSHLPTGRARAVKPTVLVELGDVVDRNLSDREFTGQHPQAVSPEVMPTPGDEV